MMSGSRFERVLDSGRFAVTAELAVLDSADPQDVYDRALVLSSMCDGINATDAAGANVHMSSVAVCSLLARAGYDPIMQLSCRDRNRIALQGELLGAAALDISNILCLTGDGVQSGDHPEALPVFDLDSVSLLKTAKTLCEKGTFLSGRKLSCQPKLLWGAGENPFALPYELRPLRVAKKVAAGAKFIQTQFCFDIRRFQEFMKRTVGLGVTEKAYVLAGIGPIRSVRIAEWMKINVPGVVIPDRVINHLRAVPVRLQREEGKKICIDMISQIKDIPGVRGVHVMAYRQEELVAEIIDESGIMSQRKDHKPKQ